MKVRETLNACGGGTAGRVLAALVLFAAPALVLAGTCKVSWEIHDTWQDGSIMNAEISTHASYEGDDVLRSAIVKGGVYFHYEKEGNNKLLKVKMPLATTQEGLQDFGGISHNNSGDGSLLLGENRYGEGFSYRSIYSIIPRGCSDDVACSLRKVSVEGVNITLCKSNNDY